ncbi:hypothetical protein TSAR_006138 [Trichomalopsis sarcophagae]|uniref:Cytochrome P450 n=1 Tax=Trichomalopsis sarcophagae TaxID=543379 RepID=A0A232FCJ2_9HYME|nr:hypothetical protein TSAR_006138 [Trichomalopsis sarcophagae]
MFETVGSVLNFKLFWISAIIFVFYSYFKLIIYSYWKRHDIPHDKPTVPFGNIGMDLITKKVSIGEKMKFSYDKYKKHPFHGLYMFHKPTLMVNDPEVIKYVLVKEFTHFHDRGMYFNDKIDPISGHLFFMTGDRWRALRIKLSPSFTSGKLKNMYPFVQEIADEMVNIASENLEKTNVLEIKELVARYTTDTIFSLAFGFNANTLRNPDSEFRHYGDLSIKNAPLFNAIAAFTPYILEFFKIPFTNAKAAAFFIKLFKDMIEQRKMEKKNRKDFLNLLIELIDHGQIRDQEGENSTDEPVNLTKLKLLEAVAQAFVFFLAGFETSSSIVTHTLYELALNPDEQEKLHQDIDELLKRDGGFNYENKWHFMVSQAISSHKLSYEGMAMLYNADYAISETLRKHPSLPFLNRICVKDCKLPNSDFVVPEGMPIIISISGLHRDPNIHPDPDKFDPTRFSKENIAARHPYAYLAFGEGPRICIGKRLGIMMSTVALATLLSKFKFSVCDRTPIPNRYSMNSILQTPGDGIYLGMEKRKK